MDADPELVGFGAGLYGGADPGGAAKEKSKKTKERSANKKKIQSSRSSLTDRMDKAKISNENPIGIANLITQECDNVFTPPDGPSGGSGHASGVVECADFPAEYKII